jgi:hypothetical protein
VGALGGDGAGATGADSAVGTVCSACWIESPPRSDCHQNNPPIKAAANNAASAMAALFGTANSPDGRKQHASLDVDTLIH